MKIFKSLSIILISFIFLSVSKFDIKAGAQSDLLEEDIPNMIIITLNGISNSDSIEDPRHQYIPHLYNDMLKEGTLYTNLINLNFKFHMPPVNSINTGKVFASQHREFDTPGIFQYVRKKYNLAKTKLWFIGNWFDSMAGFKTEEYGEDTLPCQAAVSVEFVVSPELVEKMNNQELNFLEYARQVNEKGVTPYFQWDTLGEYYYDIFRKIIREFKPKLIHYIMADVESAHYGIFSRYIFALKRSDEKIFQIWQMIQEDPFYKDNTYLIVNVDHGRDNYYMQHSECPLEESTQRIWMYIYGPNIKKGQIIERPVYHIDIFSTAAHIMGVETHPTDGKILSDCFRNKKSR